MDSSNWLDKNKRIMVGGKPRNKHDIKSLLNKKIFSVSKGMILMNFK